VCYYAEFLSINKKSNKDGIVQSASRPLIIHNCPAETPEGEGCGLLQNLATFAHGPT
jgi:hypothetical protein